MQVAQQLRQYVDLAFLQAKPQDVPATRASLALAMSVAFLTYVFVAASLYGVTLAIAHAIVDLALSAGFLWGAVNFRRLTSRFEQAFTAMCGASGVFNLAAWPILYGLSSGASASGAQALALMMFYVWSVIFSAHIYRHTLNLTFGSALLLAVSYFILALSVNEFIFAAPNSLESH